MIRRTESFIGSRFVTPTGTDRFEVISPITEEAIGSVPVTNPADVDVAVEGALKAFEDGPWTRLDVAERGQYLLKLQDILRPRLEEVTRTQIDEMGSPYSLMAPIIRAWNELTGPQIPAVEAIDTRELRDGMLGKVLVARDPVGVVASIIPWNGPFLSTFDAIIPPLLCGCPVIVKPPIETPLSAYCIADAAAEVGFPEGVLTILPGGAEVGEHLVKHPGVRHVVFTGSTAVGERVGALCGAGFKSVTLELGGKSAAIVLLDADLDRDIPQIVAGAMSNSGQVCFATTRILVPRERASELIEGISAALGQMKVGNPHDADTDFGPLASTRQRARVEGYIASGREDGATVAVGGGRPSDLPVGFYVEPTIFTDVDNKMRIAQEEIFGPVACVIEYGSEQEAIDIANDSSYGLGGAVYTTDVDHGLKVARRIRTGTCSVNNAPPGGGGGPFGGTKKSGVGRKRGREGYESYFEIQSIALPPGYVPAAP